VCVRVCIRLCIRLQGESRADLAVGPAGMRLVRPCVNAFSHVTS
jgi:hypothetical protein